MTIHRYFSEKLPATPPERFAALAQKGYSPLFTLCQQHGNNIIRLRRPYVYPGLDALIENQPEGDAVITNQPDLFIGVKTADCVPILLWDKKSGTVAAVHAGWRGTAKLIAQKTVFAMRSEFGASDISAEIGPCICKHCFVTRSDVPQAMPQFASLYTEQFAEDQFRVDLRRINARLLREAGVRGIEVSPQCTSCQSDIYWSHRVHNTQRGLQVSLIGVTEW